MSNPNFDQIIASTLQNYTPKFEDNIFGARVLLDYLKRKCLISESGGRTIVKPVMFDDNDTVAYYTEWDTILTTPQTGFTAAEYPWKQIAGTVSWSGLQEAVNSGKEQVIDLLKAKINQLELSTSTILNTSFHAAAPASNAPNSIATIVDNTGQVGGIDGATQAYWRSVKTALGGPLTLSALRGLWNAVAQATPDTPDLILTTATVWEKYESLLQPNQRYQDAKTAEAGFRNLLFDGAPVVWDPSTIAGTVYMLNSKYLKLEKHSSNWFRQTAWKEPINGDAKYKQLISYFNLVASSRRRFGKLTGVTA